MDIINTIVVKLKVDQIHAKRDFSGYTDTESPHMRGMTRAFVRLTPEKFTEKKKKKKKKTSTISQATKIMLSMHK